MSRRLFCLLFVPALLSSTAFAPPATGLWLDVPFYRQPRNGCGAACVLMVLTYWKQQGFQCRLESLPAIQRELYSTAAAGIPATAVERYLRGAGLRVFVFQGTLAMLEHHLAKGRPLIVCLAEGKLLHYVVVSGLDKPRDAVLVNDPAGRKLERVNCSAFEKKWSAENNWTLLALPRPTA